MLALRCKASTAQGSVLGYAPDPHSSFSLVVSPLISLGVGHKGEKDNTYHII